MLPYISLIQAKAVRVCVQKKLGPITSDAENPALPGDFKISWQSAAHEHGPAVGFVFDL